MDINYILIMILGFVIFQSLKMIAHVRNENSFQWSNIARTAIFNRIISKPQLKYGSVMRQDVLLLLFQIKRFEKHNWSIEWMLITKKGNPKLHRSRVRIWGRMIILSFGFLFLNMNKLWFKRKIIYLWVWYFFLLIATYLYI